jgi:hypothetical protein
MTINLVTIGRKKEFLKLEGNYIKTTKFLTGRKAKTLRRDLLEYYRGDSQFQGLLETVWLRWSNTEVILK